MTKDFNQQTKAHAEAVSSKEELRSRIKKTVKGPSVIMDRINEAQSKKYMVEERKISKAIAEMLPDHPRNAERLSDPEQLAAISATSADLPLRFMSSLVDTVKVRIKLRHGDLARCKNTVKASRHSGFLVTSKFKTTVTIFSLSDRKSLTIEMSVPKVLTGQNIAGIEDVRKAALEGIKWTLKRMGLKPSYDERMDLKNFLFELLRVDIAAHCDCLTVLRAQALMVALRAHLCAGTREFSTYGGFETLYVCQHSRHHTLCIYLKGRELKAKKKHIPLEVYSRDFLAKRAESMVRFELTIRSQELRAKGLHKPTAWTEGVARKLLQQHVDNLTPLIGTIVDLTGMDKLGGLVLERFKLWLMGDVAAFDQSADMRRKQRKAIKDATGVDINSPWSVQRQSEAVTNAQAILKYGFGFRSWDDKWEGLKAGCSSGSN
ncbi:MAG: phage/plasmid replication protein, II/X family [Gammaproteobacteria bacterium]